VDEQTRQYSDSLILNHSGLDFLFFSKSTYRVDGREWWMLSVLVLMCVFVAIWFMAAFPRAATYRMILRLAERETDELFRFLFFS